MDRYIAIDQDGYFHFDQQRIDDPETGRSLIENLKIDDQRRVTTEVQGTTAFVESFDAPLMARHIRHVDNDLCEADLTYGAKAGFSLKTLCLDEWDRFHATSSHGLHIVFTRQAQVEFFDLLQEFDDESVTISNVRYPTPPWLENHPEANDEKFWTNIYQTETPGWEKGHEAVWLPMALPQLKLGPSRVLVLGCGSGHDAAYLAKAGHKVTAVDISPEAIKGAKEKYGEVKNLSFLQSDLFGLPREWEGQFDLILEHTCYCAIDPARRNELVKYWHKLLSEKGQLLGAFFVMEKRDGPPFGGSEWEVKQRLNKRFEFLYWTRWRHSLEGRKGKELVLLAQARRHS